MLNSISYKNLIKKPGRSIALMLLSVFLCFAALAGSLFITGLRSGLSSLESRLGADVMVVPYEATTKSTFSDMILQGNTGQFYMDSSTVDKIKTIEGVGQVSSQIYLTSTSSGCCSVKVQLIGFEPETDFTITPWVKSSYKGTLKTGEVFVGNTLNAFPGDKLTFFGVEVTVAARLDRTGTYLDTAVYMDFDTIKQMITAAGDKGFYTFEGLDADHLVSCVLVNAAEGYTADEVKAKLNTYLRKVEAVQTSTFISDVSGKMTGVSNVIIWLVVAIWVLAVLIMILAFVMISNERKKEFAVLRAVGASGKQVSGIILKESFMVSLIGSVIGAAIAVVASLVLSSVIESSLGMPFLLPGIVGLIILILCSILVTIIAGSLAASISARRISKIDTALILRGEN